MHHKNKFFFHANFYVWNDTNRDACRTNTCLVLRYLPDALMHLMGFSLHTTAIAASSDASCDSGMILLAVSSDECGYLSPILLHPRTNRLILNIHISSATCCIFSPILLSHFHELCSNCHFVVSPPHLSLPTPDLVCLHIRKFIFNTIMKGNLSKNCHPMISSLSGPHSWLYLPTDLTRKMLLREPHQKGFNWQYPRSSWKLIFEIVACHIPFFEIRIRFFWYP